MILTPAETWKNQGANTVGASLDQQGMELGDKGSPFLSCGQTILRSVLHGSSGISSGIQPLCPH